MEDHRISATNLGPIADIEFALQSPGVTVLVAPNGSGKTILLDAVQAAARGEGKLPLRDRTRKGKVEAFGATITIGGTCRHTGSFEVTNLEGRFDLAALVDPRIKTPAAADRARIKALVSLTGVEASVALFRDHEAFEDFDAIVTSEALATDDPIEMATRIKASYDEAALKSERLSEREFGQAAALIPGSDINLDEESDQTVLQEAHNAARDEVIRLEQQAKNAGRNREQLQKAKDLLDECSDDELKRERSELQAEVDCSDEEHATLAEELERLQLRVASIKSEMNSNRGEKAGAQVRIVAIDRQLALVESTKSVLAESSLMDAPSEKEMADAREELARAAFAIEQGVKIRTALANAAKSQAHRKAAQEASERAGRYRDAGKATDEVLSGCIKCPQLRVESDGKSARLVTDHPIRGAGIPFHDLSDGEKWTIAIDIGADQVGEGGLLVISQVGWEGIDGANRQAIHEHAVKRGVYILTAEAASDPNATREIVPTPMAPVVEAAPVTPSVPVAPKTKEKPKPAPAKPVVLSDDDDVPF